MLDNNDFTPGRPRDGVVMLSGYGNFHMLGAAAEADKRGRLLKLYCGAYPTASLKTWLAHPRFPSAARLQARDVSLSSDDLVTPQILGESLCKLQLRAGALGWPRLSDLFMEASLRVSAREVRRDLSRFRGGRILHYRAGFGLDCLDEARRLGFILLCDHSIAHPQALDALVTGNGVFTRPTPPERLERSLSLVLSDIRRADHVLVNSDFVKTTCEGCGERADRISVVYQGVDDAFLQCVEPRPERADQAETTFCFAGFFTRRKGAHTLLEALKHLPSGGWKLKIAGCIDPEFSRDLEAATRAFPVEHVGNLSRQDLAGLMCACDVFVFPSLAEGSARVVFEAMACGMSVIVTPNAGSIAKDGVNGRVVAPGDARALAAAMTDAIGNADLRKIGAANAELIATHYSQKQYGEQLEQLYRRLLEENPARP